MSDTYSTHSISINLLFLTFFTIECFPGLYCTMFVKQDNHEILGGKKIICSYSQPKGHVPQAQLSPTSDEYILDLLGTSEQKLLKLMDELGGKDVDDIMKEMEDAEVNEKIEKQWLIPQGNLKA